MRQFGVRNARLVRVRIAFPVRVVRLSDHIDGHFRLLFETVFNFVVQVDHVGVVVLCADHENNYSIRNYPRKIIAKRPVPWLYRYKIMYENSNRISPFNWTTRSDVYVSKSNCCGDLSIMHLDFVFSCKNKCTWARFESRKSAATAVQKYSTYTAFSFYIVERDIVLRIGIRSAICYFSNAIRFLFNKDISIMHALPFSCYYLR